MFVFRRHKACGCDFSPVSTCAECGGEITAREVEARTPAAG
jgi:rRNA maturation endonuclease Nob1